MLAAHRARNLRPKRSNRGGPTDAAFEGGGVPRFCLSRMTGPIAPLASPSGLEHSPDDRGFRAVAQPVKGLRRRGNREGVQGSQDRRRLPRHLRGAVALVFGGLHGGPAFVRRRCASSM